MKGRLAVSLFFVSALAKGVVLTGLHIEPVLAVLLACLAQDALAAGIFFVLEASTRGPRPASVAYAALVSYTTLNVAIALATGSFLTWPMWRAAGGPLQDSILHYATWRSASAIAPVCLLAFGLPVLLRRLPRCVTALAATLGVLAAVVGAASDRDTRGLHRNVVVAFSAPRLPSGAARARAVDWRLPPERRTPGPDLQHLRALARGRNVIAVALESVGANYLSLYGASEELMPRLSELAAHGLVFDNAYASYPESIKGLFSVLSSTWPAFGLDTAIHARLRTAALPAELRAAGYRTALFHSGRFGYLGMDEIVRDRGFSTLEDAGDIGFERESSFGIDEGSTVRRILSWIDETPRPFFVMYLPVAGHHPYETPTRGRFPEDEELGRYKNALAYADSALGELIDGVRRRGLYEDTVWVLFGDHGEAFGQHPGNFGHTFALYDENVRVPLVVSGHGLARGTQRITEPASLVDIAPTLLDLLGRPIPGEFQGLSLLEPRPRVALLLADYSQGWLGLRDGPWKLVLETDTGRAHLFDLERDPAELHDLSAMFPARRDLYRSHVRGWASAQRRRLQQGSPDL